MPEPRKPRPVLLGESWPDRRTGGLNRYFSDLFAALESRNVEPRAVVVGPSAAASDSLTVVGDTGEPVWRRLLKFGRAAAREAPGATVVDSHFALYSFLPLASGRLRNLPLVVHFQGPWAEESLLNRSDSARVIRVKRAIERYVYRKADQLVVLSTAFKRILVEDYGVSPWKVNVIAPGVDLDFFSPGDRGSARLRLDIAPEARVAVVVRRLVPRMGIDGLLRAWSSIQNRYPESLLLVVGTGSSELDLKSLATTLGIDSSVRFLGRVEDETLLHAYRAADFAVVPTLLLEGFGLVVVEAMACGTPVIATRVGGMPEMLASFDRDLLVPSRDENALAERIAAAFGGDLPSREACRSFAEHFSWERAAKENIDVYEAAIKPPQPKPRVVFLDHCAELSGGELAMLRILPALSDVDTHVILAEDGPLVERLIEAGVSTEIMKMHEGTRDLHRDRVTLRKLPLATVFHTVMYVLRLALRLRRLRPQIVHTNSLKSALYGGVAARLAGIPTVLHIRDRIADDYLPSSAVGVVRFAIRHFATQIIANSEATKESIGTLERIVAISDASKPGTRVINRITTIPSPVQPLPASKKAGGAAGTGGLRVGIVGRLAPWKGQHVFLEAFAKAFPDGDATASVVGAALFGENDYEAQLQTQIEQLGLEDRVEMKGFREQITDELLQMDVLVHASVIPEPFGLVVVEGMAAGLPVVASAAGGPLEVIDDGSNGILYPPGDVDALASALRRLADDSELRRRLGEAAKDTASDYSPEAIAERVTDVYIEVLGDGFVRSQAS